MMRYVQLKIKENQYTTYALHNKYQIPRMLKYCDLHRPENSLNKLNILIPSQFGFQINKSTIINIYKYYALHNK